MVTSSPLQVLFCVELLSKPLHPLSFAVQLRPSPSVFTLNIHHRAVTFLLHFVLYQNPSPLSFTLALHFRSSSSSFTFVLHFRPSLSSFTFVPSFCPSFFTFVLHLRPSSSPFILSFSHMHRQHTCMHTYAHRYENTKYS